MVNKKFFCHHNSPMMNGAHIILYKKKSVGTAPVARSTHRGSGIALQSRTSNAEPTPIYRHTIGSGDNGTTTLCVQYTPIGIYRCLVRD
ncbi:MAG: hypothetical protein IJZ22_04545 [Bacteroidaceae bacterium]|nr:hypothetical protein [Bacteroidaceae bacterium]